MRVTLVLWGGPCDGTTYRSPNWPVLGAGGTPLGDGQHDLRGYLPARHNGHHWVSDWAYTHGGRRRGCRLRCTHDACPNNRRPAPPPPAGGTA